MSSVIYGFLNFGKTLLSYEYGNEGLWRVSPNLKISMLIAVFALGFVLCNPLYQLVIFFLLVLVSYLGSFNLFARLKDFRGAIAFIAIMFGLLYSVSGTGVIAGLSVGTRGLLDWFYPTRELMQTIVFTIPGWSDIYIDSIIYGVSRSIYFINVIIVALITFRTTNMQDILNASRRYGIPYYVAFTITTAFRFIPYIVDSMITIIDAQRTRGHELLKGSLREKLNSFKLLILPVALTLFDTGNQMAVVLHSRGMTFDENQKRTTYRDYTMSKKERLFFALLMVLLATGIALNLLFGIGSLVEAVVWTEGIVAWVRSVIPAWA